LLHYKIAVIVPMIVRLFPFGHFFKFSFLK
jgi:hypothetical protein